MDKETIAFIKFCRKLYSMTQKDLASKSGVGLRFIRDLEQGKKTLRIDKVNQVLGALGLRLGVMPQKKKTFPSYKLN